MKLSKRLSKRRAAMTLLNDTEWAKWSDNEIARRCNVSVPFVGKLRPADTINVNSIANGRTFIHPKTGQPTTMNTAKQRRRLAAFDDMTDGEQVDALQAMWGAA